MIIRGSHALYSLVEVELESLTYGGKTGRVIEPSAVARLAAGRTQHLG